MINKKFFGLLALMVLVMGIVAGCAAATPAATDEPEVTEEPEVEETEAPEVEETEEVEETAAPEETDAPSAEMPEECANENACVVVAPGDPIRIGFGGPLSGDVSAFGEDAVNALEIAVADAGEFEGHAYEFDAQDDLGSGDGGAAVANLFAADPTIVAVVGHLFSGATSGASPIYEDAMLPIMSPSATRIDLSQAGYTIFNRVIASDFFQGQLAALFIRDGLEAETLAIMHDGSPYGQGLAQRVNDVFTEAGGTVVAFEGITAGETDYSAALNTIAAESPDAVFFGGYTGEAAVFASQRGSVGLGDTPFVSGDGIFGDQFIELAGGNAEGYYTTSALPPADSELKAEFDAKYEEMHGSAPGALSPYSWFSYDSFMVIVAAIEEVSIVGDDGTLYIPRAALIEAVRATSGYEGVTGEVTCDENGECGATGLAAFGVYLVEGDAWVEQDFTPAP